MINGLVIIFGFQEISFVDAIVALYEPVKSLADILLLGVGHKPEPSTVNPQYRFLNIFYESRGIEHGAVAANSDNNIRMVYSLFLAVCDNGRCVFFSPVQFL